MKTKQIFILVLVSIILFLFWGYAQPASDWVRVKIKNLGTIDLPPSMEVQNGDYKKYAETAQKKEINKLGIEVTGNRIVFQNKGTNDGNASEYVRVSIDTEYGDFGKLTENDITKAELYEINNDLKNNLQNDLRKAGMKILQWNGTTIVTVNGQTALKISYVREAHSSTPANLKSPVVVNIYHFFNGDRKHSLTVSYRQTGEKKWNPLLEKVTNSFTITNIRK